MNTERPDGENLRIFAWFLFIVGALLFVFRAMTPVERYGELLPRNIETRWWMMVVGFVALQAALFTGLTSAVLRSLWHLPGRPILSEPPATDAAETESLPVAEAPSEESIDPAKMVFLIIVGGSLLVLLALVLFSAIAAR